MKQSSLFSHIHLGTIQRSMTAQSALHVKLLPTQIDCFSYFYNWDILRRVTFSRCAKNDRVINAESPITFCILLSHCNNFFMSARGLKKRIFIKCRAYRKLIAADNNVRREVAST